jgi:hypothetical protein
VLTIGLLPARLDGGGGNLRETETGKEGGVERDLRLGGANWGGLAGRAVRFGGADILSLSPTRRLGSCHADAEARKEGRRQWNEGLVGAGWGLGVRVARGSRVRACAVPLGGRAGVRLTVRAGSVGSRLLFRFGSLLSLHLSRRATHGAIWQLVRLPRLLGTIARKYGTSHVLPLDQLSSIGYLLHY